MKSYQAWTQSVERVLAGHGFLNPTSHLSECADYVRSAYDLGMTAVRCTNNIAKAHGEGRKLQGVRS